MAMQNKHLQHLDINARIIMKKKIVSILSSKIIDILSCTILLANIWLGFWIGRPTSSSSSPTTTVREFVSPFEKLI